MRTPVRDEAEIRAFRDFVTQADLAVIAASIEKRSPPEPDVLCRFSNGSHVAFELVEVCHPRNAAFFGRAGVLGKLLEETYRGLPPELRRRFDHRFSGRALSFAFSPEATTKQIRMALPRVFAELVHQPESGGAYCGFSAVREVLLFVRLAGRVEECDRPSFNIADSFQPGDVVVEAVLSKLNKTYKTRYPIELLAHFEARAWGKSSSWQGPLHEALQSQGLGPFRRVWVFGWHGVQFVYPST